MSEYIPGSAYSEGFQARMKGLTKNSSTNENPVYIQEWLTGWEDAHKKIISEARANAGCSKPKCCKNFIQD
jgi:ribosome modulation factor